MKIGVRAHDFGRMDADLLSKKIKEAGFETVQLALTKAISGIESFCAIQEKNVHSIKEDFIKNQVEIQVLGCYIEPSLHDKEKRIEQVEFFKKGIINAKILGAPIIATETTHFPIEETGNMLNEREDAYKRLKESVKEMVWQAEKEDKIIGIEPVAEHTLNTSQLARRLLDEINSDKLKIVFDPVNLLLPNTVDKQDEIYNEFFKLLGKDIVAVHVKDIVIENNEKTWRLIGQGIVNYSLIMNWLKENKPDIRLFREHVKMDSYPSDVLTMKNMIK